MRRGMKLAAVAGVAAIGLLSGGCGTSPGQYNVPVSMDQGLRDGGRFPSVEVNIFAVGDSDVSKWEGKSVTEYFSGNDPMWRDNQKRAFVMQFSNEDAGEKVLRKSDPIWQTPEWKGAPHLFIFANIPGVRPGGGPDPRKVKLSLMRDRWDGDTIVVSLERSGVNVKTPMKAPK